MLDLRVGGCIAVMAILTQACQPIAPSPLTSQPPAGTPTVLVPETGAPLEPPPFEMTPSVQPSLAPTAASTATHQVVLYASAQQAIEACELDLIDASPESGTLLAQWSLFEYDYRVRYFVPDYDWKAHSLTPELWIALDHDDATSDVIGRQQLVYGSYQEVSFRDVLTTPLNEEGFTISIHIWVRSALDDGNTNAGSINLRYGLRAQGP